ncbi:MAG: GIY-YIG nuclease family protein [Kiloniellales bacterium]
MQSARETKAQPPGHRTAGETARGEAARDEIACGEATRGGLTRERGAYLLVIDLDRPLRLDVASLGGAVLAPGRYLYCGSAHGPGGLRARVGRHLRAGKAPRWHVDRLSEAGRVVAVGVLPGGTECGLRARLGRLPGVRVPVAGFGSTDCRRCPAHLLLAPEGRMSDFRYQMSEMAWFLIPDI